MIKAFFLIPLTVLIILSCIALLWLKNMPAISMTPQTSLIDQPIKIKISNLSPGEHVTLETSCQDGYTKLLFTAAATFEADKDGTVNLETQAPISGSYNGIDPMGLFWSMAPKDPKAPHFFESGNGLEILLTVSVDNKIKSKKTIYRVLATDIEKKQINQNGVVGSLFWPKNKQNLPGVIVIPGSGGGIPESLAQIIASHGYTTLALGYFGAPHLPQSLENIDLEYFQNAISWFKKQPQATHNSITLFGGSRGGELVLLLASLFDQEINGVIAYVPSNVINGAFPYPNRPAWKYKNAAIKPFIPALTSDDQNLTESEDLLHAINAKIIPQHTGKFEDPYEISDLFIGRQQKYQRLEPEAAIPVEKIKCPLLIISGEQDKIWPSSVYCKRIMQRLDKSGSTIERKHLNYPDAGHGFYFPYLPEADLPIYHPVGKFWCRFGGTATGNARANKESWQEVLNFLKKNSLHLTKTQ